MNIIDPFGLADKPREELTPLECLLRDIKIAKNYQEKLNKELSLVEERILELSKELRAICPHTEFEKKQDHIPGSYYDHAQTIKWKECKLCGFKTEQTVETHSWYG